MATPRVSTRSGRRPEEIGNAALAIFMKRGEHAADAAVMAWERKAKLLVSAPGHGRVYRHPFIFSAKLGRPIPLTGKPRPGGPHRASAPGEPPTVAEGTFRRSLGWRRTGRFTRRYGSGLKVALYLERGTRFMKPRPWFWQSVSAATPLMRIAIRRAMAGGK